MSIENLIYNYSGKFFWEKIDEKDSKQSLLYEDSSGKYIGEIINNQIFNSNTGEYLGEILKERLIVDINKIGKVKIEGSFMSRKFNRMGHKLIPKKSKVEIPKGYREFEVGLE